MTQVRGFQQQGRATSRQLKVQWEEHWEFLEQLCDLSTAEGLQLLEDHLEKTGAGMYVNGDAPSPSDVDAFVAARGSDDLAAALATPGGDWQPGQTTMPRVWKWAQKMKSALAEQKKWDQDNLTPSSPRPGVPKEVLEDIVAEANLKKRYADTLAQVQSSRAGARPPSTAGRTCSWTASAARWVVCRPLWRSSPSG